MITGILIGILAGLAIVAIIKWVFVLAWFILEGIVKLLLNVVGGIFGYVTRFLWWLCDEVEEGIDAKKKTLFVGV